MSQPWKLLPLAALAAVALVVMGFAASHAPTASADIGTIDIGDIIAGNDSETTVEISSEDDSGDLVVEVSGGSDLDILDIDCTNCEGADITEAGDGFTIHTDALDGDENAEAMTTTFSFSIDCDEGDAIIVHAEDDTDEDLNQINCSESTPTATPTGTAGPADEIIVTASPTSVSCSGTSIITIQVRDEDGDPVPTGTEVEISATIGTITPSSGQTVDDSGDAFVFWQAPANQGGTATITAESGDAEGTTNVTANCGATPTPSATTAPPPTVGAGGGGIITPPNTGSAGLADSDEGTGWLAIAGIALLVATTLGAASVARVRA